MEGRIKVFQPGLRMYRAGDKDTVVEIKNIVVELKRLTERSETSFHLIYSDGIQELVTLKEILENGPWYIYTGLKGEDNGSK